MKKIVVFGCLVMLIAIGLILTAMAWNQFPVVIIIIVFVIMTFIDDMFSVTYM